LKKFYVWLQFAQFHADFSEKIPSWGRWTASDPQVAANFSHKFSDEI
jgi:hypothetical protein